MNCAYCTKKLVHNQVQVQCNNCEEWVHQKCTTLSKNEIKDIQKKKIIWKCEECDEEGRDTENEDSDNEESDESEDDGSQTKKKSPTKSKISPKAKVKNQTKNKISLEDLFEKINYVIDQNDKLHKKIDAQEKESKELKKDIKKLKEEHQLLKKEVYHLKNNKNTNEQDKLKNNLMISGLSLAENSENELKETVVKIGKKMKVNVQEEEITCAIVGKEKKQLKVTFSNYETKEKIMKAKKDQTLKANELGFEQDHIIFLNHDLTVDNQKLLKKAREAKVQLKYKFAWYSNGKIFLRKTENSKIVHISSEDILEDLINKKGK